MLTTSPAFNGFSTNDIPAARHFYGEVLGVPVAETNGMLVLRFVDGHHTLIYPKADHVPATYTVLNFPVRDIDAAVAQLRERGIEFADYPGTEGGIQRKYGPPIAWFTDPAGNILSVIQQEYPAITVGSLILSSPDPERLRDWYARTFDVPVADGFLVFGAFGVLITGRDEITGPPTEPNRLLVNLHVEDSESIIARLDAAGVEWVAPADQRPDGRFATFADPDGNHVQLIEFTPDYWQRLAQSPA